MRAADTAMTTITMEWQKKKKCRKRSIRVTKHDEEDTGLDYVKGHACLHVIKIRV